MTNDSPSPENPSPENHVLTQVENGVARLVLNRPEKRNALTREMLDQMLTAIERFRNDSQVRTVLFEGHGSVFCSGMDLTTDP